MPSSDKKAAGKSVEMIDKEETLRKIKSSPYLICALSDIILKSLIDYYSNLSRTLSTESINQILQSAHLGRSIYETIYFNLEKKWLSDKKLDILRDIKKLYDESEKSIIITEALIIIIRAIEYHDEEILDLLRRLGMNIDLYQGIEVNVPSDIYEKYQGLLKTKEQFYEVITSSFGKVLISELDRFLINESEELKNSGEDKVRLTGEQAKIYADKVSELGLLPSKSILTEDVEYEFPSSFGTGASL